MLCAYFIFRNSVFAGTDVVVADVMRYFCGLFVVIGHIFPVTMKFKGGKGIAVTFGCLAGLYPVLRPLAAFAFCFIFFSSILKISPHFYRTIFSYVLTLVILCREMESPAVIPGFLVITAAVLLKMFASKEEKGRLEVKLLGGFNTFLRNRRRT